MDLLKNEFSNAKEGSYLHDLKELVGLIRHYRNNATMEDFNNAVPQLKAFERKLQRFDSEIGLDQRQYIEEIMQELDVENEIEEKLIDEVCRSTSAILKTEYGDATFSLDDFSYSYINSESVNWLEFYGYKNNKIDDSLLLIVKEVFRSICYRHSIIFIDSSLPDSNSHI